MKAKRFEDCTKPGRYIVLEAYSRTDFWAGTVVRLNRGGDWWDEDSECPFDPDGLDYCVVGPIKVPKRLCVKKEHQVTLSNIKRTVSAAVLDKLEGGALMEMKTGDIQTTAELEKLYGKDYRKTHTPLTDEEHAAIEPLNRHERRAALVKMRREARKQSASQPVAKSGGGVVGATVGEQDCD